MARKKTFLLVVILIFSLFWPVSLFFSVFSAPSQDKINQEINQTDEILIKFKTEPKIYTIKISQSDDLSEIIDYYNSLPSIQYAEANLKYQVSLIPSDTYYNNQWYLQKIKAVEAWNELRESPQITIAILDSGVQINHPDLKENIWQNFKEISANGIDDDGNGYIDDINGWDFVNNTADPNPKFSADFTEDGILHGTIVAGIAAASGNNATGIAGVTWRAKIMPVKVLDDQGEGNTNLVVKGIDYAIANGANIINLSFVGVGFSKTLDDAVKRAYDAGVIIVAAAGNELSQGEGSNLDQTPLYPVCHDGLNSENRIIGVAATDTIDQKTLFSGYGTKCIDIAAPGLSIFSTVVYAPTYSFNEKPFNKYYDGYWAGTSVAVPMVSGAIALIEAANPQYNRQQIVNTLLNNADNINLLNPNYLNKLGRGRLNVLASVSQALTDLANKKESLVVAPFSNNISTIKITDQNGQVENEFLAFSDKFKGGANLATGDINADGSDEIIIAAGPGGGPHVKIFKFDGTLVGQFFAYDKNFTGGVNLACADLDQDGSAEIITGPGQGSNPLIKIFDHRGNNKGSIWAFDSKFKGGVNVAAGDINGDGKNEIIVGAGYSGGPQVRIFKSDGKLVGQFFAFDKNFRGGVKVAVGDINGGAVNKKLEIITAAGKGGGPQVRIFDHKANLISQFFAFNTNFKGGVNLASADMDNDGLAEIITAAGPGGAPHVRVFDNAKIIGSFYAYDENFNGGVSVTSIKVK